MVRANGALTDNQWLIVHLVFLNFLTSQKRKDDEETKRLYILAYIEEATSLLKSLTHNPQSSKLSQRLFHANEALHCMYVQVTEAKETSDIVAKYVYFRILEQVALLSGDILKDKAFLDYFNDVIITDGGEVVSEKASNLLRESLANIKDIDGVSLKDVWEQSEEIALVVYDQENQNDFEPSSDSKSDSEEEDETEFPGYLVDESEYFDYLLEILPENLDGKEKLLLVYENSWEETRPILKEMQYFLALCCHVVFLSLCEDCLHGKPFTKYERTVTKAISAYKNGENQKKLEFTLNSAHEAFGKLRNNVLQWIEEQYDDSAESLDFDIFTLATDSCILNFYNETIPEVARDLIQDMDVENKNDFIHNMLGTIGDRYYDTGKDLYEE